MSPTWPYLLLAVAVGCGCALTFSALIPALVAAVVATNLGLSAAARLWGDEADA